MKRLGLRLWMVHLVVALVCIWLRWSRIQHPAANVQIPVLPKPIAKPVVSEDSQILNLVLDKEFGEWRKGFVIQRETEVWDKSMREAYSFDWHVFRLNGWMDDR